jgi:hypothetical protein
MNLLSQSIRTLDSTMSLKQGSLSSAWTFRVGRHIHPEAAIPGRPLSDEFRHSRTVDLPFPPQNTVPLIEMSRVRARGGAVRANCPRHPLEHPADTRQQTLLAIGMSPQHLVDTLHEIVPAVSGLLIDGSPGEITPHDARIAPPDLDFVDVSPNRFVCARPIANFYALRSNAGHFDRGLSDKNLSAVREEVQG